MGFFRPAFPTVIPLMCIFMCQLSEEGAEISQRPTKCLGPQGLIIQYEHDMVPVATFRAQLLESDGPGLKLCGVEQVT